MDAAVDVWLMGFRTDAPSPAKALAQAFELELSVAEGLCKDVPQRVKRGIDRSAAARMVSVLEAIGATVEVRPAEATAAAPTAEVAEETGVSRNTLRVGAYDPGAGRASLPVPAAPQVPNVPGADVAIPDLALPTVGQAPFVPVILDNDAGGPAHAVLVPAPSMGEAEGESPFLRNSAPPDATNWAGRAPGDAISLSPVAAATPDPGGGAPASAVATAAPLGNAVRPVAGYRPVLGVDTGLEDVGITDEPVSPFTILRDYAQPLIRTLLSVVPLLVRVGTEDSSFQGRADWIGAIIDGALIANLVGAGIQAAEIRGHIQVAANSRRTLYVLLLIFCACLTGGLNHMIAAYEVAHRAAPKTLTAEQVAARLRRGILTDAEEWLSDDSRHFGPLDSVSSRTFVRTLKKAGAMDIQVVAKSHDAPWYSVQLIIDLPFGKGLRDAVTAQVNEEVQSTHAVHSSLVGQTVIVVRFNPDPPEKRREKAEP